MSKETTTVKRTKAVLRIQELLGRRKSVNPNIKHIHVTPQQYADYCNAINDRDYIESTNPYWHGIEIKKMGKD